MIAYRAMLDVSRELISSSSACCAPNTRVAAPGQAPGRRPAGFRLCSRSHGSGTGPISPGTARPSASSRQGHVKVSEKMPVGALPGWGGLVRYAFGEVVDRDSVDHGLGTGGEGFTVAGQAAV